MAASSQRVIAQVVLQNLVIGRGNANFYNSMCKRSLPNAGLPSRNLKLFQGFLSSDLDAQVIDNLAFAVYQWTDVPAVEEQIAVLAVVAQGHNAGFPPLQRRPKGVERLLITIFAQEQPAVATHDFILRIARYLLERLIGVSDGVIG